MVSDKPPRNLGQSIGARIRAARLEKGYTQSQLAQPDFSVSYISAIERGQIQPSLRALEILAQRLGLSSTDLVSKNDKHDINDLTTSKTVEQSQEEIELELLEAQILIQQGSPEPALELLRNLSTKSLHDKQLIRLKYLIGWAYSNTLLLQESEYTLNEAKQLLKNSHTALNLQILSILGTVYASMHNYVQALQTHQDALEQIENNQPQDPFFLALVYTNMGQHYSYLNRNDEAIDMYKRALEFTGELNDFQKLQAVYLSLSLNYAKAGDYHLSALYGYKSLQLSIQQSSVMLMSEIYHYLGSALMRADEENALMYLENALQQENVQQNQLIKASVTTHLAEWSLLHATIEEADHLAQQAYLLASDFGNNLITAEALLLWGRVAYAQTHYEVGDQRFEEALNMLEELKDLEEYTEHAVYYAVLLENRGELQKALEYYKRAFEASRKITKSDEM